MEQGYDKWMTHSENAKGKKKINALQLDYCNLKLITDLLLWHYPTRMSLKDLWTQQNFTQVLKSIQQNHIEQKKGEKD